jgi:hypothetical protein
MSRPAEEPFVPSEVREPVSTVESLAEEVPPTDDPAPKAPAPQLVYRATGAEPLPRVEGSIVRDQVPADLADAIRSARGADVAEVPVFRGPAVDAEAQSRGARAFAKDGAVYLPDSAGPIGSGRTKGLLAHELVHAVQQRTLGSAVPEPFTSEGRKLEAEAVAVERQFGGMADTPLIHPPAPQTVVEPNLAGPAQLATVTKAPDPELSHFDREARQEIDQIAESSAHRVLEEWNHPATQTERARRAPREQLGGDAGFTERRGGDAKSSKSGTFDRATRRQELEAETLDALNAERAEQGQPLLSYLEDADLERIERTLDKEQERGGRGASSSARVINPSEGGSFGDTVSFTERRGDDLRDPRASKGASAAAGRLGLAAALSKSGDTTSTTPTTSGSTRSDDTQPADTGGSFGDTVSFTERQGDDLFRGGRRPDADSQTRSGAGQRDMHGSEEEPVDLDRVDMEDLTARLYDRVRSRLRLELLVDRERSGLLTDFR